MVEQAELKEVTLDLKTLRELVGAITQAARKGLSDEDIWANVEVALSPQLKKGIERSLKDIKEGRSKRFKSAEEMISELNSLNDE